LLTRLEISTVEDTFNEGHHDLQKGMCSRKRFELAVINNIIGKTYGGKSSTNLVLPEHGCYENLSNALAPWGILPEDIPSPFNIFQNMEINSKTGEMKNTHIRPKNKAHVTFLLVMDCIIGVSACPDFTVGGKDNRLIIS
jgi:hypothetical protein